MTPTQYLDQSIMQQDRSACGCGVDQGELHVFGCLKERCPFCGGQLASCGCAGKRLGLWDETLWTTGYLPPEVYRNGLNHEQLAQWLAMCSAQGRFPYIVYPHFCAHCGEKWPDLFMVPDEQWKDAIEPRMRNKIICRSCFDAIERQVTAARAKS